MGRGVCEGGQVRGGARVKVARACAAVQHVRREGFVAEVAVEEQPLAHRLDVAGQPVGTHVRVGVAALGLLGAEQPTRAHLWCMEMRARLHRVVASVRGDARSAQGCGAAGPAHSDASRDGERVVSDEAGGGTRELGGLAKARARRLVGVAPVGDGCGEAVAEVALDLTDRTY